MALDHGHAAWPLHGDRLPSEAQWEYACRAGTSTPFHYGETITTEVANYNGEFVYRAEPKGVYRHTPTPVDPFPSNAFGLHDMHGNLWEWCADAWHDIPDVCRSAARLKVDAHGAEEIFGFRVVFR